MQAEDTGRAPDAPAMMWRAGRDGTCDYVDAAWLAFTGRALADELGDGWFASAHPDDRVAVLAAFREHADPPRPFDLEYRLRRHDGVYRSVLLRAAPYAADASGWSGFVGCSIDVDGDWNALRGTAEFFDMSLDHLVVAGFDGYFKLLSPSWTRTLGWTIDELMARPNVEFVHPDDRGAVLEARQGLTTGVPLRLLRNRYVCKDGSYRWFEWRSISNVARGVVYAVARDITEERAAQRALDELAESLTTTLNSIADGVIATDADAAITRMNPVAEKLTGWSSRDAVGRPLGEIFNILMEAGATAVPLVKRAIRNGIATSPGTPAVLVARSGEQLPVTTSCAPMRHADGGVSGAVIVFRDTSAEKAAKLAQENMQRQLIFADRMASVGTLAAGVAHEINNPLAYVMANLEILVEEFQQKGASPVKLAEWLDLALESREGAQRIKKIVRELKTFSRAEEEHLALTDLRPVLELSVDMAFNEIRHRARLVKDYQKTPLVQADEARLGQVFVNLLVNAAQALPDGATDAHEIRVATSTDARGRAVVEIRDTGPGIPEELMERIFDPFFTTKPIGVGTGLGLWICHNIVTGLGGEITAVNRPEGGMIFRIALPPADSRPAESGPHADVPDKRPARSGTVLVVDDDRAVGVAIGRVLREHRVTVVTSGKEALELALADTPFDVIVSDLMMPGMSGMDLYEELSRRRPEAAMHMIFITGGAFSPSAAAFLDRVPNERMDKPFDAAALRALVQRFLE